MLQYKCTGHHTGGLDLLATHKGGLIRWPVFRTDYTSSVVATNVQLSRGGGFTTRNPGSNATPIYSNVTVNIAVNITVNVSPILFPANIVSVHCVVATNMQLSRGGGFTTRNPGSNVTLIYPNLTVNITVNVPRIT